MKKYLSLIFSLSLVNFAHSEQLPDTLSEYVNLIRPQILEFSKNQNFENQYNLPANSYPFDVTFEGNALIYHVPNPEIVGLIGINEKNTKVLELNQSLVTCTDKQNWEIFKKGWYYQYNIYDLDKKFYSSVKVNQNICKFLMEESTEEVLSYISNILKNNLPFTTSTSSWVYFNYDNEKVEYIWKTNLKSFEEFENFSSDKQKAILDYLAMLAMKQICVGVRHNFFFERGLEVRNVYLTEDMRIIRDVQLSNNNCKEIRKHLTN